MSGRPVFPPMFDRQRHALAAGLALLAAGAILAVLVGRDPVSPAMQPVDDWWLDAMVRVRAGWLTDVAEVLSVVGGPLVMFPLRLVVTLGLAWQRRWLQLGAWVGAIVSSELCIGPLKEWLDRPRPPGSLIGTSSASFPSGHAIAASVTALGLVVVLHPPVRERTRWTVVAAAFAAVMALSRTYLGAHWLSDVVGGVCLGVGWALVWPAALELVRGRWRGVAPAGTAGRAETAGAAGRAETAGAAGAAVRASDVPAAALRPEPGGGTPRRT